MVVGWLNIKAYSSILKSGSFILYFTGALGSAAKLHTMSRMSLTTSIKLGGKIYQ